MGQVSKKKSARNWPLVAILAWPKSDLTTLLIHQYYNNFISATLRRGIIRYFWNFRKTTSLEK